MATQMIQDGRRYLVHCTWPTVEAYWEVVRWGFPSGLSDPSGSAGWITNNGFKLRMDNCTFGEFYELDNVIALLHCLSDTVIKNHCTNNGI